jgi:hypothetical protein
VEDVGLMRGWREERMVEVMKTCWT